MTTTSTAAPATASPRSTDTRNLAITVRGPMTVGGERGYSVETYDGQPLAWETRLRDAQVVANYLRMTCAYPERIEGLRRYLARREASQ